MRVLSWHLREGLRAGDDIDDEARELLLDVLWRERPHVVALQDLSGWTRASLQELAEEAELPYARLFEASSGAHHGVLSRTPLSAGRSVLERGAEAAFAVETRDLTVVSAYLSPAGVDDGHSEAEALARALPRDRTLVIGDFSVIRREERTPALDAALPADLADRFPTSAATAVDLLVQHGFVDAGEGSELGTALSADADGGALVLRVDYALHTPGVDVRALRVLEREDLQRASDHLPLVVDIAL